MEHSNRNYKVDNIRCLLILLVVFGHLIENLDLNRFYRVIYLFHMPMFLFLSGYFARFGWKKLWKSVVLPYAVFQVLYILFMNTLIQPENPLPMQFTTPFWILWYLMVLFYSLCLLPLIEKLSFSVKQSRPSNLALAEEHLPNGKKENLSCGKTDFLLWRSWGILLFFFLVSLLAGYFSVIGYFLSAARFFTFFPWFLLGYYCKRGLLKPLEKYRKPAVCAAVPVVACSILYFGQRVLDFDRRILQGSYSYEKLGYDPREKLLWFFIAASFLVVIWNGMPNRKLPVISGIGQNTMSVFLLHGFFVKLLVKYQVLHFNNQINTFAALGISMVIVLVLGSPLPGKLFHRIFS